MPPLFTITQDDFESGTTFGGSGYWETYWRLAGHAFITSSFSSRGPPHGGSFQLILWASSTEARRSADLSRETSVRLQFWARADSFEPGDLAEALVCSQGCEQEASWVVLKSWVDGEDDNTYRFHDLALPRAMLAKELWIKFRARMSDTDDWLYIDDVALVSPMPGPTPTPTPTPIPPAPAPPPPAPAPQTSDVQANDSLRFVPQDITIKVGDTVRWTNVGQIPHTITFSDQSIPSDSFFGSDERFGVTFSSPGTFRYVCEFHPPNMVGTINVQP